MQNVTFDFADQTVLVTGAAQGIGRAVSELFLRAGAMTYLVDLDGELLESWARQHPGARTIVGDAATTEVADQAVARAIGETGNLHVLVNNAGILRDGMAWKLTDDDWDEVLRVHAGATFRFVRACVPHFRSQGYGRIINVTSYTGLRGNLGQANYATAKAGIIGFTKTTAKELARFGITVNAISPNAATRMVSAIPEGRRAELAAGIPMGRYGEPEEMAPAFAFLASAEAGFITGATLPVDGGIAI